MALLLLLLLLFATAVAADPTYCDPTAKPPELCPGGLTCPDCGSNRCLCPGSGPPGTYQPATSRIMMWTCMFLSRLYGMRSQGLQHHRTPPCCAFSVQRWPPGAATDTRPRGAHRGATFGESHPSTEKDPLAFKDGVQVVV